ncbi:MAG: lipoyl(octanoyl) transferase [Verrucomicrobia bacterium RIFCSPHIGHO2_12_FULL_41_10]|nr:MAG: lipoyl(octanoyl) transferase [Verrucomicrobia bacterium RIFCSPHIGHO2_12_FULL_41_10]HLB33461.1 lipoyl(octanoyl) transferase LipB [Chthoniobacterales bacterium]
MPSPSFESRWLGRKTYDEGLQYQEQLIAEKLRGNPTNYLLLLEHEPVYTIGRTQDQTSLGNKKLPHPLHRIGRGGQATYHGPGQLVAYPIIDLTIVDRDLHRYLRLLEEVIINTLALYHLSGNRKEGMTGVWINKSKIASLGIGVRKWISLHGLALNVCGDLSPFEEITPCGLSGVTMTSIEQEITQQKLESSLPLSVAKVAEHLSQIFESFLVSSN